MQLNVCHPEIKMKEIKGTGNFFYPFINNDFDKIKRVQGFEPLSVH